MAARHLLAEQLVHATGKEEIMTRHGYLALVAAAALLAGCGEGKQPLGLAESATGDVAASALVTASTLASIGGEWSFSSVNFIHLNEFSTGLFGFVPEGKRTTIRCAREGIMELEQNGATFTGMITTDVTCVSNGGQVVAGQSVSPIVDGAIRARTISFTIADGPVNCPGKGVIRTEQDLAVALSGTFYCLEPGHPQSAWEAPPPRFGPNHTLWEANRQG